MARRCLSNALSWDECKELAADESRLHELGRSTEQQRQYDEAMDEVKKTWATVSDYILCTKFDLQCDTGQDGKLVAKREGRLSKVALIPNDFPYHYTAEIRHYVLWKLNGEGISEEEVAAAEQSLRAEYPVVQDSLHFSSPQALKSIPDIEHAHILLRFSSETAAQQHNPPKSTLAVAGRHRPLLLSPDGDGVARAAERIAQGKLVAFPTETVYGLGASALQEAAVHSIFAAKGRPLTDPLIVHVHELAAARPLVSLEEDIWGVFSRLGSRFWPGPLTLIVQASEKIPPAVTAHTGFVGIRVPSHEIAQALLRAAQLPIAAPSANRFGHVSPTRAAHVLSDLGDKGVVVLDGEEGQRVLSCQHGIESTVLKIDGIARRLVVFRQGAISVAQLQDAVEPGWTVEVNQRHVKMDGASQIPPTGDATAGQEAPGQAITHYAPDVPCYLVAACSPAGSAEMDTLEMSRCDLKQTVVLDFGATLAVQGIPQEALSYRELSASGKASEAAAELFDALRWAELQEGAKSVLVACPASSAHDSSQELRAGLEDRMHRAASGKRVLLRLVP